MKKLLCGCLVTISVIVIYFVLIERDNKNSEIFLLKNVRALCQEDADASAPLCIPNNDEICVIYLPDGSSGTSKGMPFVWL